MNDVEKVKCEPIDEPDDALRTLASAALARDSMPSVNQQPKSQLQQHQLELPHQISVSKLLQLHHPYQCQPPHIPACTERQQVRPHASLPFIKQEPTSQASQPISNGTSSPVTLANDGTDKSRDNVIEPASSLFPADSAAAPKVPVLLPSAPASVQPPPPIVSKSPVLVSTALVSKVPSAALASVPKASASTAVAEPPWYDVGIMRATSCVVTDFYFSEKPIDHSRLTSDHVTSCYASLHKLSLLPGVAYKFRVAAVNACGVGEWSDVSAFKTCLPGYPGAPASIRISRSNDGASIKWDPPSLRYGKIIEYSVCLAVRKKETAPALNGPDKTALGGVALKDLHFLRVYSGTENNAFVDNASLKAAHIDESVKPAIIFRIAARNEKGYGPATQVRWLQDFAGAAESAAIKEAKKRLHTDI